jgi:hypothetical protein
METLKLDGRDFEGITQNLTASQDDYILAHLRLSGAMDILADAGGKRTPEKKAEELLTQILVSGRTSFVLAGCLTEAGKKWNRAEADRNAAAFAGITDQTEKNAMREAIVSVVIGFFSLGEKSAPNSPKSSNRRAKGSPTANAEAETLGSLPH